MTGYGAMPGDYPLWALRDADEFLPADAKLAVNDNVIEADYVAGVRDLLAHGARIDLVGCQMHIFATNDCRRLAEGETDVNWVGTPDRIRQTLDLVAKTGRKIHVSEVTIAAPGTDPTSRLEQAILVRNIYRT